MKKGSHNPPLVLTVRPAGAKKLKSLSVTMTFNAKQARMLHTLLAAGIYGRSLPELVERIVDSYLQEEFRLG